MTSPLNEGTNQTQVEQQQAMNTSPTSSASVPEETVQEQETIAVVPPTSKTGWINSLRQRVFAGRDKRQDEQSDTLDPEPSFQRQARTKSLTREDALVEVVRWNKRRDLPITLLAWAGIIYLLLLVAQHIITTLLLLVVAAILAFALAPAVSFLQRWLPRVLAILIVYILVLGAWGL
ncbi:hypothetical protein [Dictyobacter kobayashii]|uniref:AI-2E family transporter n=1 Tax=Dictyobacter kobayashii TaxID=2014872 RepID=A0A402AMC8_9CHLR|nr:hypothetical protein [Dictyobacter kobayashii]GCE20150.1 hypothetical protein KDK_39500 [Dictyobacter kobayashii]